MAEVGHQVFAIGAQFLHFAVLGFTQAVDANVHRVIEIGEVGADFLARDEIGEPTQAIKDLQAAVDRIVVRDGNQIHPPALERGVNVERLGIAVPAAQEAEMFRPPREAAMAVQIGFIELVNLSLNHEILF